MRLKALAVAALAAFIAGSPVIPEAQQAFQQLPLKNPAYVKPFPPLRIVGNLYYVGTYDLAIYLIVTNAGNILVNTGVNDSVAGIRSNIDPDGYGAKIQFYEKLFLARLQKEREAQAK